MKEVLDVIRVDTIQSAWSQLSEAGRDPRPRVHKPSIARIRSLPAELHKLGRRESLFWKRRLQTVPYLPWLTKRGMSAAGRKIIATASNEKNGETERLIKIWPEKTTTTKNHNANNYRCSGTRTICARFANGTFLTPSLRLKTKDEITT